MAAHKAAVACAAIAAAHGMAAAESWPQFAGSAARTSLSPGPIPSIAEPLWVASTDEQGRPVEFIGQAGVVCDGERIYAIGEVLGAARLLAFRRVDGRCEWGAAIDPPYLSSWSTPAVDEANGRVLMGSGSRLAAFDSSTGAEEWRTDLERPIVNASTLVTADRGPADRAFITDYDGFGSAARLYCINIDPSDPVANPFEPGEIVWSAPVGSAAGATPAYADGLVHVALPAIGGYGAGRILAFDAAGGGDPLWEFTNIKGVGFHGGVCITGGSVYAASYAFSGGRASANLVKLNAATGELLWSAPCNRTDATPIVLTGGRVLVSGGLPGFGSLPTIQCFRDDGDSAIMLWDSADATWADANANGVIDPGEYLPLGGWTHQPIVGGPGLLAGAMPIEGAPYAACTDLYRINLDAGAGSDGWIEDWFEGAGSTPALADSAVYTVGAAGLHAFGGCGADCDASGGLDLFDFLCFQNAFAGGEPYGDCDRDGVFTFFDFLCFQNAFSGGCG